MLNVSYGFSIALLSYNMLYISYVIVTTMKAPMYLRKYSSYGEETPQVPALKRISLLSLCIISYFRRCLYQHSWNIYILNNFHLNVLKVVY